LVEAGFEPTPSPMLQTVSYRQLGKLKIEQQRPLGLLKQKIYSLLLFTNVTQHE
jgi:hypothetical protein